MRDAGSTDRSACARVLASRAGKSKCEERAGGVSGTREPVWKPERTKICSGWHGHGTRACMLDARAIVRGLRQAVPGRSPRRRLASRPAPSVTGYRACMDWRCGATGSAVPRTASRRATASYPVERTFLPPVMMTPLRAAPMARAFSTPSPGTAAKSGATLLCGMAASRVAMGSHKRFVFPCPGVGLRQRPTFSH